MHFMPSYDKCIIVTCLGQNSINQQHLSYVGKYYSRSLSSNCTLFNGFFAAHALYMQSVISGHVIYLCTHLKRNNVLYFPNVKLTSLAIRSYHNQSYHNFITDLL